MLPFLKEADGEEDVPLIAQATQFLMQRIDADLWTIVNDLLPHFEGQIASVTGVTINTATGNSFCPSIQVVRSHRASGETVTLV